jgi:hypothetical protein
MTTDDARLQQLEQKIDRLLAVEEIKKLKARYFRYLDLHWWDQLREVFTEDAVFEIAESTAPPANREAFIARTTTHLSEAMTAHHGHMPEIEIIDDTRATGVWSMFDLVEPSAASGYPVLTGFGHYTEQYRQDGGQWRIARMRLTRLKRVVDGDVAEGGKVTAPRPFQEP